MANFCICFNNTQIFRQIKTQEPQYSWHSLQFCHFFFLQVGVKVYQTSGIACIQRRKGQVHEKDGIGWQGFH